ncbi:hypothetical protein SCREM2_gp106 [Synechococcus phage S-CREM2]|nr:hypothetical protein SCREM2_gp106 [Synechococcus phage S-CREM2]
MTKAVQTYSFSPMFKLQVKYNARTAWKDCTYPARDRVAAEHLLAHQSKHWAHYSYRLVAA